MIQLIATDIDDTLLTEDKKLLPEDQKAILSLQQSGIRFILASGRPTASMKTLADELSLSKFSNFLIGFNGGEIYECATHKLIYQETITLENFKTLCHFATQHHLSLITYHQDKIWYDTFSEYLPIEQEITQLELQKVPSLLEAIHTPVVKAIILGEPQHLTDISKQLSSLYPTLFSVAISKPFFLEITPTGVNKGSALQFLATHLNIPLKNTLAVGDSYNDIELLTTAGVSVAVSNAKNEVLALADFHTTHHNTPKFNDILHRILPQITS